MNVEDYLRERLVDLLNVVEGTDIREIEVQDGDLSVRMRRSTDGAAAVPTVLSEESELQPTVPATAYVVAPLVGTFYSAGKPGMSPLVSEGNHVEEDTVVGIIEALHVLTDITAGMCGTVFRVLASDGHAVEYGQPLIEIRLDD